MRWLLLVSALLLAAPAAAQSLCAPSPCSAGRTLRSTPAVDAKTHAGMLYDRTTGRVTLAGPMELREPNAPVSAGLAIYDRYIYLSADLGFHAGDSDHWIKLFTTRDPNTGAGDFKWISEAYDIANQRDVDVVANIVYNLHLETALTFATWTDPNVNPVDEYGNVYPTDPNGYPLDASGGFTTRERISYWNAARRYGDGPLITLYGIQWDVNGPATLGCNVAGQQLCAGDRAILFGSLPAIPCDQTSADPNDTCDNEVGLRDVVRATTSSRTPTVSAVMKPVVAPFADFVAFDPNTAPSGLDSTVQGYMFDPNEEASNCADLDADPNTAIVSAACGYQQALARGFKLSPWAISNNSLCPPAPVPTLCKGGLAADWLTTETARTMIPVRTRTRAAVLQSLKAGLAYWTRNGVGGRPKLQFTLERNRMGRTVAKDTSLQWALFADPDGTFPLGGYEVFCCSHRDNGTAACLNAANDTCTGTCSDSGSIADPNTLRDYCYPRIEDPNGLSQMIGTPVYLE